MFIPSRRRQRQVAQEESNPRMVAALSFLIGVLLTVCIYAIPVADATGRAVVNSDVAVEYGVYEARKEIIVATGLAPNRIVERDGKVMTGMTVWARGRLPLTMYRDATPNEVELWEKYFARG